MRRAAALFAACSSLALAAAAAAALPAAAQADTNTLHSPAQVNVPPRGFERSAVEVIAIADRVPKVIAARAHRHNETTSQAYFKPGERWQVSYYDGRGHEIVQVLIDDRNGRVLEAWTGFQVAWTMARGYPGAFGRKSNAVYVWLPMCALFFLAFFDRRRPRRLLHLDLLVLLAPSISFAFFNHGDIGLSVPLAYPALLYFLVRLLLVARSRARAIAAGAGETAREPLYIAVSPWWLAVGLVFLIGFRVGLNVTNSNVIDVGYAGVIGAERIADGGPLYGSFPSDNQHGDTYGPVNYEAYLPFQQLLGWSGRWDDLPAAHLAAVVFDLLAMAGLYLLGLRIRGPTVALALAYAWAACPWTLLVLESNANDSLVAVLVLAALLVCSSPLARGATVALAGLTKFAALGLAPLFIAYRGDLRSAQPPPARRGRRRERVTRIGLFAFAFAICAFVAFVPVLGASWHTIYERTVGFQSSRASPFSPWGLYGSINWLQTTVQLLAVGLALVVAVFPRRRDAISLAALAGAVLIALQLGVTHWFYLYMVWFLPLLFVGILAPFAEPAAVAATVSERPERQAAAARSPRLQAAPSP
ncbi:MAG: hypothetical protein DLM63_08965 [Solirubrobacterales bacterium]|nr:MAG: hypothetical protein DLM63_08965 [Solirubrobacterales bacterium]